MQPLSTPLNSTKRQSKKNKKKKNVVGVFIEPLSLCDAAKINRIRETGMLEYSAQP